MSSLSRALPIRLLLLFPLILWGVPALATEPALVPNYRDPEVPRIQSLSTSVSKNVDQLSVLVELIVKVKTNALSSVDITLAPKATTSTNPKLIPPCVKLGVIKASAPSVGVEMPTIQSRTLDSDNWYRERHIVPLIVKLPPVLYKTTTPTFQDLCEGEYLVTSIVLKDISGKTLTITANAAITTAATTGTTSGQNSQTQRRFTDTPVMQTDFWTPTSEMPCVAASNLAPVTSTTNVNGRPVTTTTTPVSPVTLRSPCNQSLDFSKAYLLVSGAGSSGTSSLPILDLASVARNANSESEKLSSENSRLKNQIDLLNKRIDALQQTIVQNRNSSINPGDRSGQGAGLPIVDYQAKAAALQKEVDALKKQIARLTGGKSSNKQTPTPKATGKSNWNGSGNPSPKPTASASPRR